MPVVWTPQAKDEALRSLRLPDPGTPMTPTEAKQLAVTIAGRGLGQVAPNPLVGAVLVDRNGRFLAAGAHERVGGHHAEISALEAHLERKDAAALAGGTLYCTLEPCAHAGRTPACAPRLAGLGLARVVYGTVDPHPQVSGRGDAILRAAGVRCEHDAAWESDCLALAEVFLHGLHSDRPFVGLKAAASLDSIIARAGDRRAWITGARARQYGHYLRIAYDAVMVGRGTVEADDPTLDPRDALISGRMPLRVVVDPEGQAAGAQPPASRRIFQTSPDRVLWIGRSDAWSTPRLRTAAQDMTTLGASVALLRADDGPAFSVTALLAEVARRGVTSVLLEGGSGLYAKFWRAGLVDKLHYFQSAQLFGSADGYHSLTQGSGPIALTASGPMHLTPLGDDWLIEARLARKES